MIITVTGASRRTRVRRVNAHAEEARPQPHSLSRRDPVHPAVWCATAAFGLLLMLWSVAVPMYRAVDEPQHLSTALRLAQGGGYPHPGDGRLEAEVAASYPYADFVGGDERTFVAPQQVTTGPPASWPSFDQLETLPVPPAQVDQADQMTQHPPLWPLLTAGEIRVFDLDAAPADVAYLILRLLQAILLLPLPWMLWRAGRLLGAARRGAAAAAFLPLAVPEVLHIGASITDGDLLLLELSGLTLLLIKVATGDRRLRLGLAVGVVLALALLSKSFALVFPPIVVLAYLVAARVPAGTAGTAGTAGWRARLAATAWRPLALSLVVAGAAGGWWYVVRYLQDGSLQPSGYPPAVEAQLANTLNAGQAVSIFFGSLAKTSWEDLGWLETPAPFRYVIPVLLAVAIPVLVAVRSHRRRLGPITVALAPFLVLLVSVSLREISTFRQLHAVYGAQGRYLFPCLVGVGAALAVALSRRGRGWRLAACGLPLLCLVPQALALHEAWVYFWSGGLGQALDWSPLPRALLGCAAGLAIGALCAGAWLIAHDAGGRADTKPGTPGLSRRGARVRRRTVAAA